MKTEEKRTKVVLGYPFSGSIYAFFDKTLNEGKHIKASDYHSYYRTLFGNKHQEFLDLALTLSLLYEDIIIVPADNPAPDYRNYETNGEYYHPDLGIYFNWLEYNQLRSEINEKIKEDINDPILSKVLEKVPIISRLHILFNTRFELYLGHKYNCPILSLGGGHRIIKRLIKIDNLKNNVLSHQTEKMYFIQEYIKMSGLLFNPDNLDDYHQLKTSKDIRKYANSFLHIVSEFNGDANSINEQLQKLIKESRDFSIIQSKASGFFNITSAILSILGLNPINGLYFSLGALGSTAGSLYLDKKSKENKWYEFASQINRVRDLNRLNVSSK